MVRPFIFVHRVYDLAAHGVLSWAGNWDRIFLRTKLAYMGGRQGLRAPGRRKHEVDEQTLVSLFPLFV